MKFGAAGAASTASSPSAPLLNRAPSMMRQASMKPGVFDDPTQDPSYNKELPPVIILQDYKQALWETDRDLKLMRTGLYPGMLSLWKDVMANYIAGDWAKCRGYIEEITSRKPHDGPSKFILGVLEENGGKAPEGWPGYRWEK